MEYIVLGIGIVLAIFMWLIYKKLDNKINITEDCKAALDFERERKQDKEDVIAAIVEKYTKLETTFAEMKANQKDIVDFKNLFTNKTERGQLGEEWVEDILRDVVSKKHYKSQGNCTARSPASCIFFCCAFCKIMKSRNSSFKILL